MQSILKVSFIGLVLSFSALPAFAGPFGGTFSGRGGIVPNAQGGSTGGAVWDATGPNGGTSTGKGGFTTDGQGNYQYGRDRTSTSPSGQTRSVSGSSSGSYDPETGLTSSGTHTINGSTYSTTTSGGTATVTDSEGVSKTYTRPFLRR
ncbi:MAG: hypothetical protein WCD18_11175 [Thermosynechococcaceae cyanobacterium]